MRASLGWNIGRAVAALLFVGSAYAGAWPPPGGGGGGGGGMPPDPRGENANGLGFSASDDLQIFLWSAGVTGPGLVRKNQYVSGTKAEFTLGISIAYALPPLQPQGTAVLSDDAHPTVITNYKVDIQNPTGGWENVDTQAGPFREFIKVFCPPSRQMMRRPVCCRPGSESQHTGRARHSNGNRAAR